MMRSLKNVVLAVVALGTLAGCGQVPGVGSVSVGNSQASWSSPTTLLAVRNDIQRGLVFQRTVLGTDDLKPGMSRTALETVAARYRDLSASAIAHARTAPDLKGYAAKLQAARKLDVTLATGRQTAGSQDLAYTVGEYQNAFETVAGDIDIRLGRVEREKRD